MIREEEIICEKQQSTDINRRLIKGLNQLKTRYEEHLHTITSNREDLSLSKIYDLIESVSDKSMVKIQLDAIRKHQQLLVEKNEHFAQINKTH